MSSPSLRTGTRSLRLRSVRTNPPRTRTSTSTVPRVSVYGQSRNFTGKTLAGSQARQTRTAIANAAHTSTLFRMNPKPTLSISTSQLRTYVSNPTPVTADNLIEELQDLYEIAKDEFEIATDSTDGSTIYAASDRESARDALNQLVTVYELYTGAKVARTHADGDDAAAASAKGGEDAGVVETNFDPAGVSEEVRGEVRRRVGQRVRELKNAVEILEERAHDE